MNNRTILFLLALFGIINNIIAADGEIYEIIGATKYEKKYNGSDVWIWDSASSAFTIRAYTTIPYQRVSDEYGTGNYNWVLYCNNQYVCASSYTANNVTYNGTKYAYSITSGQLNIGRLANEYNPIYFRIGWSSYGYEVVASRTSTSYLIKKLYTVTPIPNNDQLGTVLGGGKFLPGEKDTLFAIPQKGCRFLKWSDNSAENPHEIIVTRDTSYTAIFESEIPCSTNQCTIVCQSPLGGITFNAEVKTNSNLSIYATAPECSKFVKWSDNDTSNPRNLTVTQDSTLTAIFEKIQFNITLDADEKKGEVVEEK